MMVAAAVIIYRGKVCGLSRQMVESTTANIFAYQIGIGDILIAISIVFINTWEVGF